MYPIGRLASNFTRPRVQNSLLHTQTPLHLFNGLVLNHILYIGLLISSLTVQLCFGEVISHDQNNSLVFHHLTSQDGLSGNSVLAITQDKRGFIWLGSPEGLDRYDGARFKHYENQKGKLSSLSSSYVSSLLTESSGHMWVGTSNGLNYFDPLSGSAQRIYLHGYNPKPTVGNLVTCMLEDSKGRVWIGTADGLFCKSKKEKMQFTRYLFGPNNAQPHSIRSIYEDRFHNFWIGTNWGLIRLSWTEKQEKAAEYSLFDNLSTASDAVTAITEAGKRLWLGTQKGLLYYFQFETRKFIRLSIGSRSVNDLMTDQQGNLWIAGADETTVISPSLKQTAYRKHKNDLLSLSSETTLSLFQDKAGSVWIGNYSTGVSISHLTDIPLQIGNTCAPNSNLVNTITYIDRKTLLIGTPDGMCITNLSTRDSKKYADVEGGVSAVITRKDQSSWVGSDRGLWHFFHGKAIKRYISIREDSTTLDSDRILSLLEDRNGCLWVGTASGLNLFDSQAGKSTRFTLNKTTKFFEPIYVLFEDSKSNIWIGTSGRLGVLRPGATTINWIETGAQESPSFSRGGVACIYETKKGRIFVGTYSLGLSYYDDNKNILVPYPIKGLPPHVTNLTEDDNGNLWMSSFDSFYKLNLSNHTVRIYDFHQRNPGYKISDRSVCKSETGDLLFGTNQGIFQFSPGRIFDNLQQPQIILTSLQVFGQNNSTANISGGLSEKMIGNTSTIKLGYKENSFTIGFSVLNYINPTQNKFAYRIKEVNANWKEIESPFVTFSQLPPGHYTFLATGANNNGVWSNAPAVLNIEVLPPWWRTWWAYLTYLLVFAMLSLLVFRFFWIQTSLRKEQELHREKLDFFANISHELRSHLMLISAPIEKMLQSEKFTRSAHQQLANIYDNSVRMIGLIKQLLDFRKTESGNMPLEASFNALTPFLKTIFFAFSELALSRRVHSEFVTVSDSIELWFDPEQFEKTVYNLLSNAYKFVPDNGCVQMKVIEQADIVQIHISNTGKGISPENIAKIFERYFQVRESELPNPGHGLGLALSKSIVELHGGTLTANSIKINEAGLYQTTFMIKMRKGNKHFRPDQIKESHQAWTLPPKNSSLTHNDQTTESQPTKVGKPTILLAENHDGFRRLLEDTLSLNYRVTSFSDGKSAYIGATTLIPDIIISDIMMPEIDGLDLCKRIKMHTATSHIPIILLTAHDSKTYQLKGLRSGADAYLAKPFQLEMLELKVKNLLSARAAIQKKFSSQILLEPNNAVVVNNRDEEFVNKLLRFVEEHLDHPQFSVEMVCKHLGMSGPVVYKKVRALLDMTVNDFIKNIRLKKAAQLLNSGLTAAEVASMVGYSDQKYFSREFKKTFGTAPGKWSAMPAKGPDTRDS